MDEPRKPVGQYMISELRAMCQKTAPDPARESLIGRFSRIFSIYTTKFFLYTPITPNQITTLSVVVFFAGICSFFAGTVFWNVVGSLLVFLSIVFDGSDGETARFRRTASRMGSNYVEPVSHDIQYGLSFFILGIAAFVNDGTPLMIVLGALASITKMQYRFLEIRYWNLRHGSGSIGAEKLNELKNAYNAMPLATRVVYWLNKNVYSQNGNFLVLFLVSFINRLDIFLWFYAVSYAVLWLMLFGKQVLNLAKNPPPPPTPDMPKGPEQSE